MEQQLVERKKLFITGATGYIGHYVMKKFIESGWEVMAVVRDETKRSEIENEGAKVAVGNIADLGFIEKESLGADAIIHCAFDVNHCQKAIELDFLAVKSLISSAKSTSTH